MQSVNCGSGLIVEAMELNGLVAWTGGLDRTGGLVNQTGGGLVDRTGGLVNQTGGLDRTGGLVVDWWTDWWMADNSVAPSPVCNLMQVPET
jgi:hypothetical protein